jgi:peptide/nickel transport system substrate-binding protein
VAIHSRTAKLGVLAALTVGTLLLAGCSSSSSGSSSSSVKSQIVVAIPGDVTDFDPHTDQLVVYEYAVRSLVFSSLVKYDANLKLVPDLATYSVNATATTFTFHINPKATFQDGTKVTATSVIDSLKRAAGEKASIYAPRLAGISNYAAPDSKTVVLTLSAPNAAFLAGLTDIAIVAPSDYSKAKSDPIGSGPYKFVSWTPNKQIVLERYDGYFGAKSPTKKIIEEPITDQQVALNDLYSGSVDILASATTATAAQVDKSRARVVSPASSNSLSLIEFNSSGKLADPRVRQALAYALDKKSIQKIAYGGQGDLIWSPLPKSSWAYQAQSGYPYDLTKAKALLASAGASNLSFTLDLPSGFPDAQQIARVWQASLAKIGVTMKTNVSELSTWLQAYTTRKYDATWNTFNVSGDPSSFFDVIMTPHLGDDYKNPQMTALMQQAVAVSSEAKRKAIYEQLEKMVVDQLPVMIVQSTPIDSVAASDVTGYKVNPLGWALLDQAAATK